MEKVVNKITGLICLLLLINVSVQSQQTLPPLERPVSLELNNTGVVELFKLMEYAGNYTFAYETGTVNTDIQLSRVYLNKTTREVLDDVFQGTLVYKEKGNYILLRLPPHLKSTEVCLEGYVINSFTNEKIPYVSIFDTITLTASVSDVYGHYSLCMDNKDGIAITTRKTGYKDTIFVWNTSGNKVLNISIEPESKNLTLNADTTGRNDKLKKIFFYKPGFIQSTHLMNFKDPLQNNFQFSVVPLVGTHGDLSSSTEVDYSFNLLGGVVGGVHKAEIGGLFNLVWDSVKYLQVAGIFNAVGGNQKGIQIGGLSNFNNSKFSGIQMGGFSNLVRKEFIGIQVAGSVNMAMAPVYGVQSSGFFNYAGDSSVAIQVAGFANYAKNECKGIQVAGFANAAQNNFSGIQVAGFSNHSAGKTKAIQVSGFMNTAIGDLKGHQVAGFINTAQKVEGTQIGFLNFSDSISGVPVGFLSFSRKGLHQLELSGNEVMPANIFFRTGVPKFFNSLSAAIRPYKGDDFYWGYGYGIGTSWRLSSKMRLFADLHSMHIQHSKSYIQLSTHNKLSLTCQYTIKPGLAIALGPALNVFVAENHQNKYDEHLDNLVPYHFFDNTYGNDINIKMWTGGSVALRFF